jgi:hypothetical protein
MARARRSVGLAESTTLGDRRVGAARQRGRRLRDAGRRASAQRVLLPAQWRIPQCSRGSSPQRSRSRRPWARSSGSSAQTRARLDCCVRSVLFFKVCAALERAHKASDAGWSSLVARWAHNPKVAGSNPAPATNDICKERSSDSDGLFVCTVAPSIAARLPLSSMANSVPPSAGVRAMASTRPRSASVASPAAEAPQRASSPSCDRSAPSPGEGAAAAHRRQPAWPSAWPGLRAAHYAARATRDEAAQLSRVQSLRRRRR